MKHLILLVLGFVPCFLFGQSLDSTVIKQVDSLRDVSYKLATQQAYDEAFEVSTVAEELALENFGRESKIYGGCCFTRAIVYYLKGDYPESEKWYLNAKTIREKKVGKEDLYYAMLLNNLATLYKDMGQYEKAESLYLVVKNIQQKIHGTEHSEYGAILNNIAAVYVKMGQLEKAEPFFIEARGIWGKTLGTEDYHYAVSLYNLASIYSQLGQREKVEPLSLEATSIFGKILGKEHPDYASSLHNLSCQYHDMGQHEKAKKLALESLTILEKVLGREHPRYAMSLNNIAYIYADLGQFEKAEPLYLEANALIGKTLGKEHPEFALNLITLAKLYLKMGKFEKAELLLFESKAIQERVLGKEHSDYARSLDGLGNVYRKMGQYKKAESLLLKAKDIWGETSGKDNNNYVYCVNNLAGLYRDMGQYQKAEQFCFELSSLNQDQITKALLYLSEQELSEYLDKFSKGQDQIFSLTQLTDSGVLSPVCFDNSLFYKGFLLNAAGQVRRLAISNPNSSEKLNQLKGYRRRLASQYALPLAERDSMQVAKLEENANTIEKDLIRSVAGLDEAMHQVDWQEVQGHLKEGEVALEFVHYQYHKKERTDSISYAALVLLSESKQPRFISLFEEEQLIEILKNKSDDKTNTVNNIYKNKSLYNLIWQPLEKELNSPSFGGGRGEAVKTIYYSPSGLLHRLNLNAIQNDEMTLGEKYKLVQLNSTRQLVVGGERLAVSSEQSANALLFGGIKYDMDTTEIASVNYDYDKVATRGSLNFSQSDPTYRGGSWDYLDWTEIEVSAIESILKESKINTTLRDGYQATEEAFKSIASPSPRILHIATHGFFFPDPSLPPAPSKGGEARHASLPIGEGWGGAISDHPMIRSGLIMAGGNHAWETGKPYKPNMEDGILTAYEISQMDLSNTELVVLSACETGLGDIEGNEGVYGLQRAFKIAGAKYLVMSLWQVPDYQTQELMKAFYKKWLNDKMTIPDAFRAAQQMMKEKYDDPFLWAGFVLVE